MPFSPIAQAAYALVEQLRTEKNLSIAEIAAAVGYRSPNSIERIVQGRTGDAACKKFLDLCMDIYPDMIHLPADEPLTLPTYHACWSQLLQGRLTMSNTTMALYGSDGHALGSIGQHYELMNVSSVSVLLLNGLHRALSADLAVLLSLPCASVYHCLTIPYKADCFSYAVLSLMPLLFHEHYHLASYSAKQDGSGLLTADIMLVRYQCQAKERMDMIAFTAMDRAILIPLPPKLTLQALGLSSVLHKMHPIGCRKDIEFQADYLKYVQWCATLEAIGPIRQLKEDVCFEQIPTPIMARALREGLTTPWTSSGQLMDEITNIATVCNKRSNAWHLHQKEHVHIMRLASLWQFVRTGMLTDHFWGMRAFSVSERMTILEELRQAHNGNNFRLLFLPDCYWNGPGEITCYGKSALSIIQHSTNYQLSEHHKEILISDKKVIQSFISFFDKVLVPLCQEETDVASELEKMLQELNEQLCPQKG